MTESALSPAAQGALINAALVILAGDDEAVVEASREIAELPDPQERELVREVLLDF